MGCSHHLGANYDDLVTEEMMMMMMMMNLAGQIGGGLWGNWPIEGLGLNELEGFLTSAAAADDDAVINSYLSSSSRSFSSVLPAPSSSLMGCSHHLGAANYDDQVVKEEEEMMMMMMLLNACAGPVDGGGFWWEWPIEGLRLSELEGLLTSLEELIAKKVDKKQHQIEEDDMEEDSNWAQFCLSNQNGSLFPYLCSSLV
ncbi:hypothetical protein Dimus_022028 [Dionaea muscipula]